MISSGDRSCKKILTLPTIPMAIMIVFTTLITSDEIQGILLGSVAGDNY